MKGSTKLGTVLTGVALVLAVLGLTGYAAYWVVTSSTIIRDDAGPGSPTASADYFDVQPALPPPPAASARLRADSAPSEIGSAPTVRARENGGTSPESRPIPSTAVPTGRSIPPSGQLLIPVHGVLPSQLVDTYAQARSEGRRHDAIDIMAPRGTPVVAVADGTVLKLFQSVQGGITLYQLGTDQRTIYYYAHLERYAPSIAEGVRLRTGAPIGFVGDTGNSGAGNYHLHFEVSTTLDPKQYWGGTPTNPYPLLGGPAAPQ